MCLPPFYKVLLQSSLLLLAFSVVIGLSTSNVITNKTPTTLLTGFLGAGKTTTIYNLLENREGLRIAVLVNDLAAVNVDAALFRRRSIVAADDKGRENTTNNESDTLDGSSPDIETIELSNGCICCGTGATGLAPTIIRLQTAEPRFDHIVVELSGVADPANVLANLGVGASGLGLFRELSSPKRNKHGLLATTTTPFSSESGPDRQHLPWVVAVVDAHFFPTLYKSLDFVSESMIMEEDSSCVSSVANTAMVELLTRQIEHANVILLNKCDLATRREIDITAQVCAAINNKARIVATSFGSDTSDTGEDEDHGDNNINIQTSTAISLLLPSSTTTRNQLGNPPSSSTSLPRKTIAKKFNKNGDDDVVKFHSFVYTARRPFITKRLLKLVDSWPLPIKNVVSIDNEGENENENNNTTTNDNHRQSDGENSSTNKEIDNSVFKNILRSKGVVWLDSYHKQRVGWSHAGRQFRLQDEQCWWAALPNNQMKALLEGSRLNTNRHGGSPSYYDLERRSFFGNDDENEFEYGDRRQEIVFIGLPELGDDETEICRLLDTCLAKDDEMVQYQKQFKDFEPNISVWLSSEYLRQVAL